MVKSRCVFADARRHPTGIGSIRCLNRVQVGAPVSRWRIVRAVDESVMWLNDIKVLLVGFPMITIQRQDWAKPSQRPCRARGPDRPSRLGRSLFRWGIS